MGEIENHAITVAFIHYSVLACFFNSVHISFCSGLIFSVQGENGQDYQS